MPSAMWQSSVFLQVLPGTVLDEVQHLCVPPEVIHQLLERDMLLSAEDHLELYDSPIVLDLDAGERPFTTTTMMPLALLDEEWSWLLVCFSGQEWDPSASLTTSSSISIEAPEESSIWVKHRTLNLFSLKVPQNSSGFLLWGEAPPTNQLRGVFCDWTTGCFLSFLISVDLLWFCSLWGPRSCSDVCLLCSTD